MIEDGLFLVLGLCLATLIGLASLPVLWSRALRRTSERLARVVPSSQAEIDAVHDGLRAQAAVAHRRLEQRIEAGQREAALVKAELGRRTVSLVAVETSAEALRGEHGALLGEVDHHLRTLRDGEGQRAALEKALHDADAEAEVAVAAGAEAKRRLALATSLGHEQGATIAALEARVAGLSAEVADGRDRVAALEAVAAQHAKAELAVEAAFELKRAEAERLKVALASAEDSLREERQQAEDREGRLQDQAGAVAATEARMAEQDALIKRRQTELAALKLRIEALEDKLRDRVADAVDEPQAAGEDDGHLRNGIIAVGNDALRLLQPIDAKPDSAGGIAAGPAGDDRP